MANSKPRIVAFQGEPGAFSSIAAGKLLGPSIQLLPCASFKDLFGAVHAERAAYAVVPIENTLYGSIHENYDHLLHFGFPIIAETTVRIEHHLIGIPGVKIQDIRQAYSHPVALGQCLRFFARHSKIVPTPHYDTAGSVKMLMEKRLNDAAAIASQSAAELYGGAILKANIEDDRQNFTRFFLLSKQKQPRAIGSVGWKTSIAFVAPNSPGALFKALACFALRDLNLSKIESRPLRSKPWEYLFYVDVLGCLDEKNVQNALTNLREISSLVKVLGTYQSLS